MHRQSHSRPWALLRVLTIAAGTALFILAPLGSASAYTEKALHSFCTEQTCGDGAGPQGSLLRDRSGNLYGTTVLGGKYGEGLVFKLVPNGDTYKEYILHNFCAQANCPDGARLKAASSSMWTAISMVRRLSAANTVAASFSS